MKTAAILASFALTACTSEGSIDDYLSELGHLPSEPSSITPGTAGAPTTEPNMTCTTQPFKETRQHDQVVALAAGSESLWAGSLVRGDAVYSGSFTPIALERAPMAVSISLANLAGSHSATLAQPTLSAYREALAGILAQRVTGATPANLSIEMAKIDSEEQIELAIGANGTWNGLVDIKAGFDWNASAKKSRYLVKFVQAYFTVDVDAPARASDVFAPSVSLDDIKAVTGANNPPVYVSSITYGRSVIFTFESDSSSEELGVALQAAYKGPGAVGGMLSVKDKDVLSQSKISAYILGGAGGEAVKAIDSYDALIAFIRTGGDYSPQSPGAPIAYKLAHLADNEPARLSFTHDYEVKTCTAISGSVRVRLESVELQGSSGELDGTLELFGVVTVSGSNTPGGVLMTTPRNQAITIHGDETLTDIVFKEIIVPVEVNGDAFLTVFANLSDADTFGDTSLGTPYYHIDLDGGWEREFDLVLTGGGRRVLVHVTTQPI